MGRYLICGRLASGGMASVYLGRLLGQAGFSKIVAIKRLHQRFVDDPAFFSMLIDEARLASSINHPNVVSSLDVVAEGGELLLVMEYIHGETLAQLLKLARKREAPVSLRVVQRILCDTLDGLHAAHTATAGGAPLNIVHRDVSPQNVIVDVNGVARVLDFGIAKAASSNQHTQPGHIKGKFSYMSPEQVRGLRIDARTDVFSAGVVLWECLTGERLFFTESLHKTAEKVLCGPIPAPSTVNPALSADLDRVTMKALSRDPGQRYATAAEFADALRALGDEATRAEVSGWVSTTASVVLAERLRALEELETTEIHDAMLGKLSAPLPRAYPPPPARLKSAETLSLGPSGGTTRSLRPLGVPSKRRGAKWALAAASLLALALAAGSMSSTPKATRRAAGSVAVERPAVPPPITAPSMTLAKEPPMRSETEAPLPSPLPPPLPKASSPKPARRRVRASPAAPTAEKITLAESAPAPNPTKPVVPPEPAPPVVVDCNPPYRIDLSGVRRVRRECL